MCVENERDFSINVYFRKFFSKTKTLFNGFLIKNPCVITESVPQKEKKKYLPCSNIHRMMMTGIG
jgi:hypothetical protein